MERTLKAVLRYDGTGFSGWQVQSDRRTVQGALQAALSRIASRKIHVHGAGRTDAGVHALAQVASFAWPGEEGLERLRRSLSRMLGSEIRIEALEEVPADFHARKSALGKRYAYTLSLAAEPDPLSVRYAWALPGRIDLARLSDFAQMLVGTHDFAGFQGGGAAVRTTVRTLYAITVREGGVIAPLDGQGLWRIEFVGNGFLYKMVRNMTSTLVDIARGALPEDELVRRLNAPGPYRGHTAPACGLTLLEIVYEVHRLGAVIHSAETL